MPAESKPVAPENDFLSQVRALALRGDLVSAQDLATQALHSYPRSVELRRALAGIHRQRGDTALAQNQLQELLADHPGDFPAAITLAGIHRDAGRLTAVADVLCKCFEQGRHDAELAIRAIDLLADCGRTHAASQIVETAISVAPDDVRLHAYAGMLDIQIGEFERAREHYLFAMQHSRRACDWHVPLGLSTTQRYASAEHPDFELFSGYVQRADLDDKARSSLLFALAKAYDDIGDYRQAAACLRQANDLAHRLTGWSRKQWRRAVQSRLESRPYTHRLDVDDEFVPVFILGMPRTGTTLTAELLSRYPQVRNRGELPWLPKLVQLPDMAGDPAKDALRQVAAVYRQQAVQDDAPARWYIDKQPLNFRYVGPILAMFPHARIVHCRRSPRDTALSLWMQAFVEEVQGFANDFSDIALVMRDCDRLMMHWNKHYVASIRTIDYERLVAEPDTVIAELAAWLGLPTSAESRKDTQPVSISTASLWQARQPVHTRSVGRWRHYAEYVPELLKIPDGT